jgi:hypothetical protein
MTQHASLRRYAEARLDFLRDDVARWPMGEVVEVYGKRVTATPELASSMLAAAEAAVDEAVAEWAATGKAPIWPADPDLEIALKRVALRVVELRNETTPLPYPRGAQAHEPDCDGPPCKCFDFVLWLAKRASQRDPDLQSEITERALKRAERNRFPPHQPSTGYMRTAYSQLRADELRHRQVARRRETPGSDGLDGVTQTLTTSFEADFLLARLPPQIEAPDVQDWQHVWSADAARLWLASDPLGLATLELVESRVRDFPAFVRNEGRAPFLAVALAALARHLSALEPSDITASLAPLIKSALERAVGGDPSTGGHAKRLARTVAPALRVLSEAVGKGIG